MPHALVRSALVLSIALGLSACTPPASTPPATTATDSTQTQQSESDRLNAWFDVQYEQQIQSSPILLTFLGRKDQYDQIDDFSEAATRRRADSLQASVAEMETRFDFEQLDPETRLSWALWKRQAEEAKAGLAFLGNGYAFEQMSGMQSQAPTFLIGFHKVDSEADYLAYLSRLQQIPRAFDQLITRARASAKQGIRPPAFAYHGVVDQSRKVVSGAPFSDGADSALWADAQAKADALQAAGAISAERAEALKADAKAALLDHIAPGYARLIAWCEEDLPNAPENASGIGSTQPNGADYYAHQLKLNTTTDMSAEEIHALGLAEVARLREELEALRIKVGFQGDLAAFFKHIENDPALVFPNTDEGRQAYIDEATAYIDNIKHQLPNYFGLLPKADLVVKRVEPFREQDGAAQHYFPGTPDGSRPGVYYAHLSDMHAMPKTELEVIAYHEGLPGHHMQISIAQELAGVPQFRTQYDSTAYAEGWALYTEWLAKEMPGTYREPHSEFGRLMSEMWRAIRLVVDTGLHAKGWTEQQAVDYFRANSSVADAAIRSEIQRYLVIPGQATAYKIGMIRIQQLRQHAEAQLGDRFDIRGFHDAVLGGGALPLDVLAQRVDLWIERSRAG